MLVSRLSAISVCHASRSRALLRPFCRGMASMKDDVSHEERTASEPRNLGLHHVQISKIEQVNDLVRVIDLKIMDAKRGVRFLPGQWLDVFIPGMPRAGGFTLTSTPFQASPRHSETPSLQLAIQKSPRNPPAAWLWKPQEEVLNQDVLVRVGGSFIWPPRVPMPHELSRAVFIAAGVGINPLISMLGHLDETSSMPPKVEILYTSKIDERNVDPQKILFLPKLQALQKAWPENLELKFFVTSDKQAMKDVDKLPCHKVGRIDKDDLDAALGDPQSRQGTVCYVCGPPAMTDDFVEYLGSRPGMHPDRVLRERWW